MPVTPAVPRLDEYLILHMKYIGKVVWYVKII
jgi:hypothetical protein